MKLSEIIEKLDTRPSNEVQVDLDTFTHEFNLSNHIIDYTSPHNIKAYWIFKTYDTDTIIGAVAYFQDGKLICISTESSDDKNFEWVSEAVYIKVKKYVKTFVFEENYFELLDMSVEMGEGYVVNLGCDLMSDVVLHNGKLCPVIEKYTKFSDFDKWRFVQINVDGGLYSVLLCDCLVPYNIV